MRSTQSYVPASSSPYRLLSSSVMAREANLARRPPVTTTAPPGATGSERSLGSGVVVLGGCDFGVCTSLSGGPEVRVADVVADRLVDDPQASTKAGGAGGRSAARRW